MPMRYIIYILVILGLTGCTSSMVLFTWVNDEKPEGVFTNVMILGLVNNVGLRSDVESEFVYAGQKARISVGNGMSMFPPELGKPFDDIERTKARLREKGYDAVMTTAVIDIRAERYVAPEANYEPLVYYDRFRNYYYRTYDLVYKPGYVSVQSSYYLETNLYDLKTGFLIWSGRSKVFHHAEMEDFLKGYSYDVFRELSDKKII